MEELTALEQYAASIGQTPAASWGQLVVVQVGAIVLDSVRSLSDAHHYSIVGRFGAGLVEVRLSRDPPSQPEVDSLRSLTTTSAEERDLETAATGWGIAEALESRLEEIEIRLQRANWYPYAESFGEYAAASWIDIASRLQDGPVVVGDVDVRMTHAGGSTAVPIFVPSAVSTDEAPARKDVLTTLEALADTAAWRNVAVEERRSGYNLHLALHRDQAPAVIVDLEHCRGGVRVWQWLSATSDANREEALRYVLRFLTANALLLPDGLAVVALAERQRIALSRDNAAEVQRAIVEGRERTVAGVDRARSALAEYVEDTSKTVQATLAAAIGIVALVAQASTAVPSWLLWLVTAIAVIGVVVLILERWTRIGELRGDLDDLVALLSVESDPLLPAEERTSLRARVERFDVNRRARHARRRVVALGSLAVATMLAGATWLVVRDDDRPAANEVIAATGFVRANGSLVELCERLDSAVPPACGGRIIDLRGLDLNAIGSMSQSGGIRWTTREVRMTGTLKGETLTVISVV